MFYLIVYFFRRNQYSLFDLIERRSNRVDFVHNQSPNLVCKKKKTKFNHEDIKEISGGFLSLSIFFTIWPTNVRVY